MFASIQDRSFDACQGRAPGRRYARRFAFQDSAMAISAMIASAASRGFFA
jgi:hypothetical protein